MKKKVLSLFLLLLLGVCLLAGCYSYTGLDKMSLVAGVGIDKDDDGIYQLSFEVVDITNSSKESGLESIVIESQGKTIFDAIRNARNHLPNKLYFGNNSLIIISKKVAGEDGLLSVIDFFLRDEECRETVHIVISGEEKALDILKAKGLLSSVTSFAMHKIIDNDVKHAGTINSIKLYEIYNLLLDDKRQVCLPLIETKSQGEEQFVVINGMALFKKDKLVSFFDSEDSKYCLFASDDKEGGIITLENGDGKYSLEIFDNSTDISFTHEDGKFVFTLKTNTEVFIGEDTDNVRSFSEDEIKAIEKSAQDKLEKSIGTVIKKVQDESSTDIFGFSQLIYKKNPKLWRQVEDSWDEVFSQIQVDIISKVIVLNTAYLK